ncbi:MAG: FHA domain-containing protein [Gemmataceae bacterium]|nr:FHA domain-containing protein [Gemmataceae bacterium]
MRAQLVPLDGGSPVEVAKEMTVIGRQEECDLRLDHKSVSKMHCVLVKTDGLLLLRDLGSTNGPRVNGTRIRRAALLPNDKLSVANFHFTVLFGAALLAAVQPEDQTQQIDPKELQKLTAKPAKAVPLPDSAVDQPIIGVHQNALPDLYPDDDKKKP